MYLLKFDKIENSRQKFKKLKLGTVCVRKDKCKLVNIHENLRITKQIMLAIDVTLLVKLRGHERHFYFFFQNTCLIRFKY